MKTPYETFDIDLREGKAREDAFVHVLLRSRVEHKRDFKYATTGNIAVEYEQKARDGNKVLSGISITEAGSWAVEFLENRWLVVPTETVKALARRAIKNGKHKWIGDGNNHHNALIPIDWFTQPGEDAPLFAEVGT